ncbi:HNH endonuclease signature motif containing protein [Ornithinimicrobium pekingense]|uniref:HNH nuclease domain-containing protein n=1 Tax=Ornithinimicrobium pekingense TaxID=384677 RepID=A0ABQ2F947_9MICO|nr:HNH endonuclease signature motif containing protein [Ornithinimicrobium pekingense]GGK64812.1 hypothetical protein GCM10011509_11430 [Ornithinimicrobium pekingense]
MTVSAAEHLLTRRLHAPPSSTVDATSPALLTVLDQLSPGVWRRWFATFPVLLEVQPTTQAPQQGDQAPQHFGAPADTPEARLRAALAEVGLDPTTVDHFALAALTAGALRTGTDLACITGSAPDDDGRHAPAPGSDRPESGSPDLAARTASASSVLDLVGSLTRLTAHLEGTLVGVVGDLTVRNGTILLAQKGAAGPDDLTPDQTRRWRARSKSVTRREIEALTGWGEGEVSDLVALATSPAGVQGPVVASMKAGVTPWRLARRFLRELGHEAHEDTAESAERLFGTDPQTACTARLDPDGDLKEGPWEHKLFNHALNGEATRLASRDPQTAAQDRHRNRQKRDARVVVHEDGTGSITVSGTASQVSAVADRLERGARAARGAGDPRTLANLRADIAMSLLMHSGLALPDPLPPDADDLVRTRWTEQMRAVLHALPRAVLNVIVPFDALVHSPARPLFGSALFRGRAHGGDAQQDAVGVRPPHDVRPVHFETRPRHDETGPPHDDTGPPRDETGPARGSTAPAAGHSPPEGPDPAEVLSMGLVTGAFPQFLTPDAIRELALAPGTTLHRLLMDPADGRCVERSVASYAPDAAMRTQVHAADVTCRAPGCVQHAPYTQLDHVVAHGEGGPTSESNLQALHSRHHQD